jgi:hypothetical protein
VGPQNQALIKEEGGLHPARRVARRDVERREVVVVGLDLGPLGHAIAQADEEGHHVVYDPLRRVQVAPGKRHARKGDVYGLGLQTLLPFGEGYFDSPRLYILFYLARGEVRRPPDLLAVFGRQGPDALLDLGDLRRASEEAYPHVFETCGRIGGGDGGEGLRFQLIYTLRYRHTGRLW